MTNTVNSNYDAVFKLLLDVVQGIGNDNITPPKSDDIPIGISNRHLHLSQEDLEATFGKGYQLTPMKDLAQPGQFAAKEMVTICGPKGAIEKVRVLGPTRKQTQVEISQGDGFKLGVFAPSRQSGDLAGSAPITIIGDKGSIQLSEGLIVAQRHIHMTSEDAIHFGVYDGQVVGIEVVGDRGGIFNNVLIRANSTSATECHLDTDEANAMNITPKSRVRIIK